MSTLRSSISTVVSALRVYQWTKNLLVFAALVFAQQMADGQQVVRSVCAFLIMCAASSAAYLLNDLIDIEKDRQHPDKCKRPLASGAMSILTASVLSVALFAVSLAASYLLHPPFCAAVVLYAVLTLAYTFAFKHMIILDVLTVAIGFVIRAIAGAVVLDVTFSNWLVVCTLFLALFLSLGKRRSEIELMDAQAINHREVLGQYSVPFLDGLITVVTAATLLTYTIYTCSPEVVNRFGTDKLYFTLPFVVYGLFRYLHVVHHEQGGGDPTRTLFADLPLAATVVLWGLTCIGIIYGGTL